MKKILFCVYGLFLTFVIGYIVYANMTFDGAIAHSYKKGMAYPQKLAQLHKLGWRFQPGEHPFRTGEKDLLELWIRDKHNNPVHNAAVQFMIYRPASLETMPTQTAEEKAPGHYVALIQVPQYGNWLVKATVVQGRIHVEHEFPIYVDKG